MGRTKRAFAEICEELKERAKEAGLNIRSRKQKSVVQNKRTRKVSEILTKKDNDMEVVRSFKYLETNQ
jgi:hypothetical protein